MRRSHPDDKWGWAVGAGILLKMPWDAKDTFAVAASTAKAPPPMRERARLVRWSFERCANLFQDGGVAAGWWDDAYFGRANRGQLELPKVWSVQAGFQHYWTNSLRSSIWGVYSQYEASSNSVDTLDLRSARLRSGLRGLDHRWQVGSRTIWNPVTNLDIGLEVMYTKIETAFRRRPARGSGVAGRGPARGAASVHNIQDNDVWSGILRIQRNFWP